MQFSNFIKALKRNIDDLGIEKINQMLSDGVITQEEHDYITK